MATPNKKVRDAETDNWAELGCISNWSWKEKKTRASENCLLATHQSRNLQASDHFTEHFLRLSSQAGRHHAGMSYARRVTQSDVGAGQRLASLQSVTRGSGVGFKHQRPREINHQRAKGDGQILATPSE